jgi:biotin transporter BioY
MSRKVHSKVAAGTTAGAASVVLVWLLGQAGVAVPAEVASALTTLIAFAGGYLKASE